MDEEDAHDKTQTEKVTGNLRRIQSTLWACRDAVRKAKAQLSLARDVKGNKKGFYKYLSGKRKTRKNVGLLLKGSEDLVTQDVENAAVLEDPVNYRLVSLT